MNLTIKYALHIESKLGYEIHKGDSFYLEREIERMRLDTRTDMGELRYWITECIGCTEAVCDTCKPVNK